MNALPVQDLPEIILQRPQLVLHIRVQLVRVEIPEIAGCGGGIIAPYPPRVEVLQGMQPACLGGIRVGQARGYFLVDFLWRYLHTHRGAVLVSLSPVEKKKEWDVSFFYKGGQNTHVFLESGLPTPSETLHQAVNPRLRPDRRIRKDHPVQRRRVRDDPCHKLANITQIDEGRGDISPSRDKCRGGRQCVVGSA